MYSEPDLEMREILKLPDKEYNMITMNKFRVLIEEINNIQNQTISAQRWKL